MKSRARFFPLVCCLLASVASAQPQNLDALKREVVELVDSRKDFTQVMVDSIFSFSELGFQETQTSKSVTEILEKEGFQVQRGVAGMPTAWVASWGRGKPVIGFMADIDGLPETSQKPGVAYHDPLIKGGPGHGRAARGNRTSPEPTRMSFQPLEYPRCHLCSPSSRVIAPLRLRQIGLPSHRCYTLNSNECGQTKNE